MARMKTITIKGAKIIYKDFSGTGEYANGKRTFCVLLDKEDAVALFDSGYNVKFPEPKIDELGNVIERNPYLKIRVSDQYYPIINMISDDIIYNVPLNEVGALDRQYIKTADLSFKGSEYTFKGKTYITAWLIKMYVKIEKDELDQLYSDLPMQRSIVDDIEESING